MENSFRVPGDLVLVSHKNDGDPLVVEILEQTHDLRAGLSVESPGRLIRQDKNRIIHQGPRDSHPLLLPTGQLKGLVVGAILESHRFQHGFGSSQSLIAVGLTVSQGQFDILYRGGPGEQVESLKNKPDLHVPCLCQFIGLEAGDIGIIQKVSAGGGPVQTA
jgi:hypothetical protein